MDRFEITAITNRLCQYTARESGVAILAHTDAGTADLYVEGQYCPEVLTGKRLAAAGLLQLKARHAKYYDNFDLLPPMTPDLFIEMAELYLRMIQARFSPDQMQQALVAAGIN